MTQTIKQIDEKHIAIIETTVSEQLIAKVTLEAQKAALLNQVAEIDEKLILFVAKK